MLLADIQTLFLTAIVTSLILAVALSFAARGPDMAPLRPWAAGLLLHTLLYVLLALRGSIPDFLSIVVANTAESAFVAFWALAIAQFSGRRLPPAWLVVPPLLTALNYGLLIDHTLPRIIGGNSILLGQIGLLLYQLRTVQLSRSRRGVNLLIVSLAATAFLLLLRIILLSTGMIEYVSLGTPGWLHTLVFLTGSVIPVVGSLGFLFMLNERAGERISESEARFRTIYDAINDAIFVHDPSTGQIVDVNARASSMYGYQREQLLALDISRISANVPPYTQVEAGRIIEDCMKQGWQAFEWLARDSRDQLFWVAVNLQMITLGGEQRVLAVIRNIDKSKRIEEELRAAIRQLKDALAAQRVLNEKLEEAHNQLLQSEKMASIGQLAAGVAHELNNPIGFVYSNLGTLKTYLDDIFQIAAVCESAAAVAGRPEDFARIQQIKKEKDFDYLRTDIFQLLTESVDGLQRVKKIVKDLKDFSRPGETDWQWADLNQGLESTLNIVWNELKYKCTVTKDYGELPQVHCLAAQLNQVFMNLLVNAAQAIETKGEITIATRAIDADTVEVRISDTGKGIKPEHLNRLFEPFFTTKPVGKGTGLGLSIAWGIIEKHHGKIEVASEVGKGTCFTITLPVAPSDVDAVPPVPEKRFSSVTPTFDKP